MAFDQAFAHTVGLEGAYSNNPSDRGSETMWGITAAVARANGYLGPMAQMPIETAKAIYRARYWDLLDLDNVDQLSGAIAAKIFDIAVNCGPGVPVPFLQRALNAFNRRGKDYPDIPADGRNGPGTIAALTAYLKLRGALGERVLLEALSAQQGVRYFSIAENNEADEEFMYGWWANRVLT